MGCMEVRMCVVYGGAYVWGVWRCFCVGCMEVLLYGMYGGASVWDVWRCFCVGCMEGLLCGVYGGASVWGVWRCLGVVGVGLWGWCRGVVVNLLVSCSWLCDYVEYV